jgi:hypothetical protein
MHDEDDDDEPAPAIEDARGPHLPDPLTRHWAPAIFVVLAIGYVAWYLTNGQFPTDASLADVIVQILQVVPAVASILLPAAILWRHPDAWSSVRTILFGAILLAADQGLLLLANPLQGFFETITPPGEDLSFLVPSAALYNALISLVAVFGLGYIAVGLSLARRYADTRPRWLTGWFVPAAVVFGSVVGVIAVSKIDFGGTPMTPPLAIYLASSVVLGVLRIAVWALVASVATRGWIEGEEPRAGWSLAAVGSWLVLLALAIVNLSGVVTFPGDVVGTIIGWVIVSAYAAGHLLVLIAFLVGLPAVVEDGDEEESEDVATSDDDLDDDDNDLEFDDDPDES